MANEGDIQLLPTGYLAGRCGQESERFFRREDHDTRFCFELMRRGLVERDQRAWELLYAQYRALVAHWVTRHPAFAGSHEEPDHFINGAFERFWNAIPPERFAAFADLRSLLRYLQMCAHSAITDEARIQARAGLSLDPELARAAADQLAPLLDQSQREAFWSLIAARLRSDQERRVIYGSCFLALKPREIYAENRAHFRDVAEVYRVKENLLARLRRDAEIKNFFIDDA